MRDREPFHGNYIKNYLRAIVNLDAQLYNKSQRAARFFSGRQNQPSVAHVWNQVCTLSGRSSGAIALFWKADSTAALNVFLWRSAVRTENSSAPRRRKYTELSMRCTARKICAGLSFATARTRLRFLCSVKVLLAKSVSSSSLRTSRRRSSTG